MLTWCWWCADCSECDSARSDSRIWARLHHDGDTGYWQRPHPQVLHIRSGCPGSDRGNLAMCGPLTAHQCSGIRLGWRLVWSKWLQVCCQSHGHMCSAQCGLHVCWLEVSFEWHCSAGLGVGWAHRPHVHEDCHSLDSLSKTFSSVRQALSKAIYSLRFFQPFSIEPSTTQEVGQLHGVAMYIISILSCWELGRSLMYMSFLLQDIQ